MKVIKRAVMGIGALLIAPNASLDRWPEASTGGSRDVEDEIIAMGLEVERTLKRRADSKTVVLCRHPRYGRCVYKGFAFHSRLRLAHAHVAAVRAVAMQQCAIFPRAFEIGDRFSVEEYVPGRMLAELEPQEWRRIDLIRFIDGVRDFGMRDSNGTLGEKERVRILKYYVRKSLNDVAYGSLGAQISALGRLIWRRRDLRALIRAALESGSTELPGGWATNDLNVRNVMLRDGDGELVVVDFEDVGRGSYMFDLTWFLAHAARLNVPSDALARVYHHMFQAEACGTSANARFFKRLLAFFLAMNAVRRSTEPTIRLLELVTGELERSAGA